MLGTCYSYSESQTPRVAPVAAPKKIKRDYGIGGEHGGDGGGGIAVDAVVGEVEEAQVRPAKTCMQMCVQARIRHRRACRNE